MLAADKQLLDATLRHELQALRLLELNNIVARYQSAIPVATLLVGFTFTGIVELEILDIHNPTQRQRVGEKFFYIFSAFTLAFSMYAMSLASLGIIFGQRLAIQANAWQSSRHDQNVREMNQKFLFILIALSLSLLSVIAAGISVIWVKAVHVVAIPTTCIFVAAAPFTAWAMYTMNQKLNTHPPVVSNLNLRSESAQQSLDVADFYVGDRPPVITAHGLEPPKGRNKSFIQDMRLPTAADMRLDGGKPAPAGPSETTQLLPQKAPEKARSRHCPGLFEPPADPRDGGPPSAPPSPPEAATDAAPGRGAPEAALVSRVAVDAALRRVSRLARGDDTLHR